MKRKPYYSYYHRPKKRSKWLPLAMTGVVIIAVAGFFISSTPPLSPQLLAVTAPPPAAAVQLPWPKYGQSAVGAQGYGVLATSKAQAKPVPTASVAKIMTALAVLKVRPLAVGETGPDIPITDEDVASFNDYTLQDGTVVKVVKGQRINQHQALQAMLIRSANNMADTLARWAFGSVDEYLEFANGYAQELGLHQTHFADATGFSPQTVSTAQELVILGEQALNHPLIAEIVATWQVDIPEAGTITNSNLFLDFKNNGVIGIKTGDTEQAGGVYLVAAKYQLDGLPVTVIGAVMGAPSHFAAQQDTMPLLRATRNAFHKTTLVKAGQAVGSYDLPWNGTAQAVAERELTALNWADQPLTPTVDLKDISIKPPFRLNQVGEAVVDLGSSRLVTPLNLAEPVAAPSLWWRLQHLFHVF